MLSRRAAVVAAVILATAFAIFLNADLISKTYSKSPLAATIPLESSSSSSNSNPPQPPPSQDDALPSSNPPKVVNPPAEHAAGGANASPLTPQVLGYFEQAFSAKKPAAYDFAALRTQCARTAWREDEVYLQCTGMAAGLTSIMSQVKVCLKMAVEAGTGLVLPAMPLRNSTNLAEFNFLNPDAYMPYDEWFDAAHLLEGMGRACPKMKIVHPKQLGTEEVPVKHKWLINLTDAPGYKQFASYFWTGRPFGSFFGEQFARLANLDKLNPNRDDSRKGITVVTMASNFLLFRITDDPTGQDLKLWNDLGHLIRFTAPTRELVAKLLAKLPPARGVYGVHFRVEADTIWSSLEHQLGVDLDALDQAWSLYGSPGAEKPLVYLACGDEGQVAKFVEAGKARGWEVTHKWQLASGDAETLAKIGELPFDFQGAVDMGFMVRSDFFLGITGSAFSSTGGNARDVTGR